MTKIFLVESPKIGHKKDIRCASTLVLLKIDIIYNKCSHPNFPFASTDTEHNFVCYNVNEITLLATKLNRLEIHCYCISVASTEQRHGFICIGNSAVISRVRLSNNSMRSFFFLLFIEGKMSTST